MNKDSRIFLALILFVIALINGIISYFNDIDWINYEHFYWFNLFSVVIYLAVLYFITKIGGIFSIHFISGAFIFLFLYGRSLLYIINPSDSFFYTELILYENIGLKNMNKALIATNIFVYIINIIYFRYGKPDIIKIEQSQRSIKEERILFPLIIFSGLLYSIKLYLEFKQVLKVGYVAIYSGGLGEVNYYSAIIRYSHIIFMSLFSYYLILVKDKKRFIYLATLYLILSFLDSLKGARIALILPFFYILWYFNSVFRIRFNTKNILRAVILFTGIIFYSIYTKSVRNDDNINLEINIATQILEETGSTLQVVGRYIKNRSELNPDYPYMFEPITYPYFYFKYFKILTSGQSYDMLEYRNSLNHHLTSFIDMESYLFGRGVGSSTISEFSQYGLIPLCIFSLIYGSILLLLYNNLSNRVIIYLSSFLILHFFFISRESPFPNLIGVIKGLLVYYPLNTLLRMRINFPSKLKTILSS